MIEMPMVEVYGIFLFGLWMGLMLMAVHVIITIRTERR